MKPQKLNEISSGEFGGIVSLDDNAIPEEEIPKVPTYELQIAKGGETTYELDSECRFADGRPIKIIQREAIRGEKLRDVDLRYKADISANLKHRGLVRAKTNQNKYARKLEMAYCRSSIIYFCNTYCWTFVPGELPTPFVLYPFQEEFLKWSLWIIKTHQTGLVEKSRKIGATWIMRVIHAYLVLFFDSKETFSLSMSEADVDDRTNGSLLGKQRYLLNMLPDWMRGGWVERQEGVDLKMLMQFPHTKGMVKGLLTAGTAGRSRRGVFGDYDEFAHVESASETIEASSSLCESEIFVSTVKGMGNEFAKMAHDPRVLKLTIHWTLHPLLNLEWAIKERAKVKYTEEIWNQEMEIDYGGSTSGRVYQKFKTFSADPSTWCHVQKGDYFEYDPNYDVYVGLDFGISDPNALVYAQIKPAIPMFPNHDGKILIIFDEDENRDQTTDDLAEMLKKKGYRYASLAGDLRSAAKRNYNGRTMKSDLAVHGFDIVGRFNTEDAPITEVKRLLEKNGGFCINEKCKRTITCLQNWAFKVDKSTNTPLPNSKPRHDQYSHINKALCYLADHLYGDKIKRKSKHNKPKKWKFAPVKKAML